MPERRSYIAGVGQASWSWPGSWLPTSKGSIRQLAISAGTKALLDAGITYDDVDHALGSGAIAGQNDIFYVFGKTGIPIHGIESGTGIYAALPLIARGDVQCVLIIDVDQLGATGVVIVSKDFIQRHPYLKDTAAVIHSCARKSPSRSSSSAQEAIQYTLRESKISTSDIQAAGGNCSSALKAIGFSTTTANIFATRGLSNVCELVWLLRGWKDTKFSIQNCLHCAVDPSDVATAMIISRADGQAAPAVKDATYKNDGRERLGYNPATQVKDVAVEDLDSVKARPEYSDKTAEGMVWFRKKGGDRAALAKL